MTAAEEIFADARELADPAERAALLDRACGKDSDLRARVEALLRDADAARDFFGETDGGSARRPDIPVAEEPGCMIGRYQLLERIGEGGMGVVFMAEQREPVTRRVALKVIKLGLDTRSVMARFEAERQALALMDHPNIAKVLDAGSTPTGRPFFVMELVQGVPINEFCAKQDLTVEELLRLFLPVCHAVQHAHQKGIIHRDLKPSNILVTRSHGAPHPLVIDFGVAKATQQQLTEKTLVTNFGTMIGTPAYMSPEQAELGREDVDTRTDLYSLGVLLYELLTGTTPFPEQRLRSAGLGEMQRIIREEEPERPSTRLTRQQIRQTRQSGVGSTSPFHSKRSSLDPDLDWIVMKCLEKDRLRRFATVNGLAADLQRYLANEPVTARPPTAAYRLHKAVCRHRLAVVAGATVALTLAAGLAATSWQAVRATRAERAFQEQAETATSVKTFLVEQVLGGADTWKRKQYDPSDRVLIERIAREVEGRFTNQPIVEAAVRDALTDGFFGLDDLPNSLRQAERAFALRKEQLGPTHADTLASASKVGSGLYALGRHREGDQMLDDTIAAARSASMMLTPGVAEALHARGWKLAFDGNPEAALPYVREAFEIFGKTLGEDHARTGAGKFMLAVVTERLGQTNEAAALFQQGILHYSRALGTNDPLVGVFLKGNGLLSRGMGRTNEAIAHLESALAILQQSLGPENQYTLEAETHLADTLARRGDTNEATARWASLHRRWARHLPYDLSRRKIRDLAQCFVRYQRYDEARAAYADVKRAFLDVPPQQPFEFEMLLRSTAVLQGWPAASRLCEDSFDQFPDSIQVWIQKACVFRYVGLEAKYREVVYRVMVLPVSRIGTNEWHLPIEIASLGDVTLPPAQLADLEARILDLEARLPARKPELRQRGYRALGQYRLRTGNPEQALASLERSQAARSDGDAYTLYLKTICLSRLNRRSEALAALNAADTLTDAVIPKGPEAEAFLDPDQIYQSVLLRREAHAQVDDL